MKLEFAIKKDVLKSGSTRYSPVCRQKSLFFPSKWNRIVKLYDDYVLMEIEVDPNLSYEECKNHIVQYKSKLEKLGENDTVIIEFDTFDQKPV